MWILLFKLWSFPDKQNVLSWQKVFSVVILVLLLLWVILLNKNYHNIIVVIQFVQFIMAVFVQLYMCFIKFKVTGNVKPCLLQHWTHLYARNNIIIYVGGKA